jgi:hypothetical protein
MKKSRLKRYVRRLKKLDAGQLKYFLQAEGDYLDRIEALQGMLEAANQEVEILKEQIEELNPCKDTPVK